VATIEELGPELPRIARNAIVSELRDGRSLAARREDAPAAGVFVTLRKVDGSLRGCIGSITPVERDVVAETARSAVLAATRDPRFPPVSVDELIGLVVEVSVLEPEEPVDGVEALDPEVYGVIVRDRFGRRGLLLPGIDGIVDPAIQVALARQKAGIAAGERVLLSRFRVRKYYA
jgi:AmmeMemoRadiSam system protein A